MIETIFITVMAVVLLAYVAIPLFFPKQADTLPDNRDPRLSELEGERDALLRAIQELEFRQDLPEARRDQLRARYEAKAANVLRELDNYQQSIKGNLKPSKATQRPRRFPFIATTLLTLMVATATALGGWVLPRLGSASVTVFFEDDLQAAQQLQRVERAVAKNPNFENYLALADTYWQLGQQELDANYIEKAVDSYLEAEKLGSLPAEAAFSLGLVLAQSDLEKSLQLFEQAVAQEPENADYIVALAQLQYQQGFLRVAQGDYTQSVASVERALEDWRTYQAMPEGKDDSQVALAITEGEALLPLLAAIETSPDEENLLALAEALWQNQQQEMAATIYERILLDVNNESPVALSRIGQMVFFLGNTEQAIGFLSAARELELALNTPDLNTLLFLGNAHFTQKNYQSAIDSWQSYIALAGGSDKAGRVPQMVQQAEDLLAGRTPTPIVQSTATGAELYGQHCSLCHGAQGQGGSGPRLAANSKLSDAVWLRKTIVNGRGAMPAYQVILSEQELTTLVNYLQASYAP